jgi:hypothetical protein
MSNERFGGSLVAPYRTEESQHTPSGTPTPDPADGRFGGTLAAIYAPPVEEPKVEDFVQPAVLPNIGTEVETLPEPVVEPEPEPAVEEIFQPEEGEDVEGFDVLHHVEDEHIPNDSKHFHGKNKKRR